MISQNPELIADNLDLKAKTKTRKKIYFGLIENFNGYR